MKKVVYVGTKEIKADNISGTPTSPGTGLVWTRGQVHEIQDEKKADRLLEHPLVWRDASNLSDADIAALLLPELKAVPPEPRVSFIPETSATPYLEPAVVVVPEDVLKKLQAKELVPVFMTDADADAFAEWKLERDTRPSAPAKTGPKAQAKETKPGTDSKAGLEASAKKAA